MRRNPEPPEHVVFTSYGNDSVALIQHLHEKGTQNVVCVYSDTGWAAPWWRERVEAGEELARSYGFGAVRLGSMGMQQLVQIRKGWPSNQYQFCTANLKVKPALEWLDKVDPDREAICVIGVRREESRRRAQFPEWTEESEKHGGRDLWAPMVRVREKERDALVRRAGLEILPHRSMECYPCVNANRQDFLLLDEARIAEIEKLEQSMGHTSKGKPRYMFRPGRFAGRPEGIREVIEWARSKRGEYAKRKACDSGWCGL